MNSRLISIIRKEFIQIFRDKRTLALILVMPLVQLFLLGYAATNDVRNVPLAVYDQSHGTEARALLDAYRAADYFKLAYSVGSQSELQALIDNGQAKAGLIIPPDFAKQLNQGTAQVAFVLDGSEPTVASTALSAAQLIGQYHATRILSEKFDRSGQNFPNNQFPWANRGDNQLFNRSALALANHGCSGHNTHNGCKDQSDQSRDHKI